MKYFILLFVFLSQFQVNAQDYFNRIIPFEYGNPNFLEIEYYNDQYYIPVFYPGSVSTLIETDMHNDNYYQFQNFDFTSSSIVNNSGNLYLYGKDRSLSKALGFGKLNDNITFDWFKEIDTKGDYNFPGSFTSLNQNLYMSFFYMESEVKKLGIHRSNSNGEPIWTRYYENNIGYSYPWDLIKSSDNNLFSSYTLRYNYENKSKGYVMKLDSIGNVIWKTEPLEKLDNGGSQINILELSNNKILVTYEKDMSDIYEYWCCLDIDPPTFVWLDINGEYLTENTFKTPNHDEVYISNLKNGNGDYFYGFGQYQDFDGVTYNFYGFITKYSNNGDTIWSHKYRHPDYNDEYISHVVKNIIELENGDILVLGKISRIGDKNNLWLFKVNSEGCFGSEHCDEIQIVNTKDIQTETLKIELYPNPVHDFLTIETEGRFNQVLIYDLIGNLVMSSPFSYQLDVSYLPPGMYILKFIDDNKIQAIKPIVKR